MSAPESGRVAIYTPGPRLRRLTISCLLLSAASAFVIVTRPDGLFSLVAGILALAFFGPVTLGILPKALRRTPVLVLDADGFTDRAGLLGAGFVPWTDVRHIAERTLRAQRYVAITVHDPAALLRRLPAWQRPLRRLNRRLVRGDVLIPATLLPMPPAQLVRTLRNHASHS
jgi:hypothetical protein